MSLKNVLLISASLAFLAPLASYAQTTPASEPAAATSTSTVTSTTSSAPSVTTTTVTAPAATAVAQKAEPAKASASAPVTHAEFEQLLTDTLVNNPEIIMSAVKKLHDQHMEQANKEMKASMEKHKQELTDDTVSPSVGDPKITDITVVEFFDYHCGYCKHMLPVVTQLLHEDKKVHFIFREFPILAEDSVAASRAAIAVYKIEPDKYFAFHTALMNSSGKFDDKSIAEVAKKVGIDPKKLKKAMENPDITKELDDTRAIAEDMGIRGTPALIVGGELLPGAVPFDDLLQVIDNARKGQKADIKSQPRATAEPVAQPAREPLMAPAKADGAKTDRTVGQ